jgi:hypothetical protein
MPALLTAYLEPEMEAMFVVASVPAGCPAQPGIAASGGKQNEGDKDRS